MSSLQKATLEEIRTAAARICRDYLTGRWKVVTPEQLVVKRISGGLSNFLYYISLPQDGADKQDATVIDNQNVAKDLLDIMNDDNNANRAVRRTSDGALASGQTSGQQTEPQEVLLRIYGQTHGEDALEAVISESVVFALLSERNFGPKLHGVFPGGRIEQYIPARPLKTLELQDAKISKTIAEKMAEIHSLNIPMSKEPDWLWNTMERWLKNVNDILSKEQFQTKEGADVIGNFSFPDEALWLKSVIESGNFPVLFCHNDMQEGNILKKDDQNEQQQENVKRARLQDENILPAEEEDNNISTPDLMIIDFEYCAYNYRGFDFANHFLEWTFDYTNPEYPYYYHLNQQYPSKEQRQHFFQNYLRKSNEHLPTYEPTQQELEFAELEVQIFSMFSHLFWSLWSIVNLTAAIEFGYWEYALCRIGEYQMRKQQFLNANASGTNDLKNIKRQTS